METLKVGSKNLLKNSVLILPMRNGNHCNFKFSTDAILGSYPTYEEWKLTYFSTSLYSKLKFLSYLWGMETIVFLLLQALYHLFLSYLWGMETRNISPWDFDETKVLILPMRNGNKLGMYNKITFSNSSYPTYEEWKQKNSSYNFFFLVVLILPMRNGN